MTVHFVPPRCLSLFCISLSLAIAFRFLRRPPLSLPSVNPRDFFAPRSSLSVRQLRTLRVAPPVLRQGFLFVSEASMLPEAVMDLFIDLFFQYNRFAANR